jgi:lambda repressor-like predicted transcriptional regulator
MNKIYVKLVLSSEGETPKRIVERMKRVGALPLVGDFDFELDLTPDERLFDKLDTIHKALKGSRVHYTVTTLAEASRPLEGDSASRPIAPLEDLKPAENKRALYRKKLDRWREMGLDVSELEELLDSDMIHFKEASKDFLRTHLNNMSVVRDKHPSENLLDGEVLALLDDNGRTIEELSKSTGYSEDQVTLSLGRLISSGSASLTEKKGIEKYVLVPPPAPPPMKKLRTLPAGDDEEAEDRIFSALSATGTTRDQLLRATRLPEEQLSTALASLSKKGRIRVIGKGKKARFVPA